MLKIMRVAHLSLFLALLLGVGLSSAYGQAITGTLTGIVMDKSQAVIPNASVTLKNEASGEVLRTVTNAEGYFSISGIRTGSYSLTIGAQGFANQERTGIVFNPGDTRTMGSVTLEVGAKATEVTVTAQPEMVSTDSPEKSVVISEKELQNIAIVGRSAAELIKILPGMSMTGTGVQNTPGFTGQVIGINGNGDGGHQSALGYYAANGLDTHAMDITGDGAHVSDPGCNCATPVNPNVDMIQEFKVLQSNYSAENSKGPVVLNFITGCVPKVVEKGVSHFS